jgi:hypothetical protein
MAVAGVLLLVFGGSGGGDDPVSGEEAPPPVVGLPPEIEDVPIRVTRGGLIGPALEFVEIANPGGIAHVVTGSDGFLGIRSEPERPAVVVGSSDGATWFDVAEVPPGVRPMGLVEWRGSPLVVGIDVDQSNPRDILGPVGDPGVWALAKGSWLHHELDSVVLPAGTTWVPSYVVTVGEGVLIVGFTEPALRQDVLRVLPSEVVDLLTLPSAWLELDDSSPEVSISLFGSRVWDANLEDLGLASHPERDQLDHGRVVLASADLGSWVMSTDVSRGFLDRIDAIGDGRVGARAWLEGPGFLVSDDGLKWAEDDELPGSAQLVRWYRNGLVVAMGEVLARSDGERWRPISPTGALAGGGDRQFVALEVLDGRLVSVTVDTTWDESEGREITALESLEGYRVEIDHTRGTITSFGETTWTWQLWQGRSGQMSFDPQSQTVELLRDSQPIVTLDVEDLREVDYPVPRVHAEWKVLVTTDERTWHLGSFEIRGASPWVAPVLLVDGNALVIAVSLVEGPTSAAAGLSVWAAPLP